MYRALSLFPEKLEEKFLDANDFRNHFADFYGRPVQDIVEALHRYGRNGYFKAEIMLTAGYLTQGSALDKVTLALNKLQPEPASVPATHRGLSELVYTKTVDQLPLTIAEVRGLPDGAGPYLAFKLSDIDRQRLREALAIYNDNSLIPPSRLVKNTKSEPSMHVARVSMEGQDRRFVRVIVSGDREYTVAKLHVGRAPYDFMHYLFLLDNSDIDVTIDDIHDDEKGVKSCSARDDLTELVRDCGFDKALKDAFFPTVKKDKVHFRPVTELNTKQFNALKKRSAEIDKKS
jgi:hypothetical protein